MSWLLTPMTRRGCLARRREHRRKLKEQRKSVRAGRIIDFSLTPILILINIYLRLFLMCNRIRGIHFNSSTADVRGQPLTRQIGPCFKLIINL